jgi:hypothetical protein
MGLDKSPGAEEIEKIIMGDYELFLLRIFFLTLSYLSLFQRGISGFFGRRRSS